jgi:D-3-phosphoglycerate dehydrogenase
LTAPEVLIFDPIQDLDWSYESERDSLARHGVRLTLPVGHQADAEELARADVLIVSGPFPSELFTHLRRCVGIICYSVGMDAVDLDAAASASIKVTNVAGYCTDEVSDHAMALLLALQRRLVPFVEAASRGEWDVYSGEDFYGIRRLRGQTLGIVGIGRIGSQVAVKAGAFGMDVLACDPYVTSSPLPHVRLVELDQLLAESDAVVLCSALTATSRHVLDADRIAAMRPGAVLVNVARGGLVDESALASALGDGRLSGAALDVREHEPPPDDDPLRRARNVVLTQHMAATSQEARADLHVLAAERAMELLIEAGRMRGDEALHE